MNSEFLNRLKEYLDSECDDYGLDYKWEWIEDCNWCEVTITRDVPNVTKTINFKYNSNNDDLEIELSEDSFYATREFDYTVKYFWMLIAPAIFPEN
jgi:hypothetical protein